MQVYYISSSIIPSKRANTVHVLSMCRALTNMGYKTTLFARSNTKNLKKIISDIYGLHSDQFSTIVTSPIFKRGTELYIAIKVFYNFFNLKKSEKKSNLIISRNLFAAFLLNYFFKKKIIYETHMPETQIMRKLMQKFLLRSNNVKTVVISNALKNILLSHHNLLSADINVFHDASFDDINFLSPKAKIDQRKKKINILGKISDNKKIVGYFGHLYQGRGIEIIEELANNNTNILFLVFGGLEKDLQYFRKKNKLNNLHFMGHLDLKKVKPIMSLMDILLMPYQKKVSISAKSINTVDWMSPIKMFEYMSVKVPIISSNLPVLTEVLNDRKNCLLVEAESVKDWSFAINELINNKKLANKISNSAYKEFTKKYTWELRAKNILNLIKN